MHNFSIHIVTSLAFIHSDFEKRLAYGGSQHLGESRNDVLRQRTTGTLLSPVQLQITTQVSDQ
jgi:hypothetical protein